MKKFLLFLIAMMVVVSMGTVIFGADTQIIKVQQNGKYIDFKDNEGNIVNPQIINNRTMVPFRKIFNSLGVTDENIIWNGETKTINAKKDNIEIELQINNDIAKKIVDGKQSEIKLDSVPVIRDNRTLVPIRFIAESMNKKVGWDADNRTVIIIDTKQLANDIETTISKYMEIMNSNAEDMKEFSTKMNLKGQLDYKSTENKADNSTLNLDGTVNIAMKNDTFSIEANVKITGKGELYNELDKNGFTDFKYYLILKDDKMYIKSTTTDSKTAGKWIVHEDESIKQMFDMLSFDEVSFENLFEIDESKMNIRTYEYFEAISNIIKGLFKNENITITEKGKNKTYSMKFDLAEVMKLLNDSNADLEANDLKGTYEIKVTEKNDVTQNINFDINFNYVIGKETFKGIMTAEGKVAKTASPMSAPGASQTIDAKDVK